MAWATVAIAVLLWSLPTAAADDGHAVPAVAAEIRAIVDEAPRTILGQPVVVDDLRRLYGALAYAPLWHLDAAGREGGPIIEEALRTAGEHGFDVTELHLDALRSSPSSPRSVAERDLLISDSFLRYAGKLRRNSVSGDFWQNSADRFDPIEALVEARRTGTVALLLASLPPQDIEYSQMVDALRRFRSIADGGGWPVVPGTTELKLTLDDPRLPALRERLEAEGDLVAEGGVDTAAALVAAVRRFQRRHGLEPDGRVGSLTLRELAVTADQRSRQIAVNLERWRWLPRRRGDTYVTVNAAAATLALTRNGRASSSRRVIVGDTKHPTPSFAARITAVTLNPPWNVPTTIAAREILPRLKRNPLYLAANDVVILGRPDDPFGLNVDWRRITAQRFPFRLQQRPGHRNALGGIKFEMPNRFDVYLHDTPDKRLFARPQRALSHGCIRVDRPTELAAALLDDAAWSVESLETAIAQADTRRIELPRSVPIYLVYFTAFVDEHGQINFRHDLYGRDTQVERTLGRAPQPGSSKSLGGSPGGCPRQPPLAEARGEATGR